MDATIITVTPSAGDMFIVAKRGDEEVARVYATPAETDNAITAMIAHLLEVTLVADDLTPENAKATRARLMKQAGAGLKVVKAA